MNHIQNLLRLAMIVILTLFAFGPSTENQAAPVTVEPTQFSCTNVTEIPQSECEALVAIYNPGTNRPSGWLETTTPCNWSRIACEDGHVTELNLFGNELSSLPAEIGNLTNLTSLILSNNELSSLPAEIGNLANLTSLVLWGNEFSSLPAEISNLASLTELDLSENQLSSLSSEIGNLTNLTGLYLNSNRLSSLPAEIGSLTNLTWLYLDSNQLSSLPAEIGNLTNLMELDLKYNRLDIPESELRSFITNKDSDWADTQTIAPTEVQAAVLGDGSVELIWKPILFQGKGGHYEISVADDGTFTIHGTTTSKSANRYLIENLTRGATYDIRVRTYTPAHNGGDPHESWDDQPNELWSEYSPVVSATIPILMSTPTSLGESQEPLAYKLFLPFVGRE